MTFLRSKFKSNETTIFTEMSNLSNQYSSINLGQGFPNFDCPQELKDLVNKHLQAGKNQYCPMPGHLNLREILAQKSFSLYERRLDPKTEITITAGATQAIFTAIHAFVHPGDEVILIEPAYDSYAPTIEMLGAKVIPYSISAPNFKINWSEFENLISDKTSMVIINTPHNPTGSILYESDLLSLQEILADSKIILLSDEVYEHLIFDDQKHQSAQLFDDLFSRSICIYSFGKTFHSTGWKIGYCLAPEPIMAEFRKVHQWNVFSVNSFVQYALADFLKDPKHYLSLGDFYQEKRDLLSDLLAGSRFKPIPSKGSYFQLYNYGEISQSDDKEFASWLIKEHGVASIPISVFYEDKRQQQLIRFCFAKTRKILEAAAEKLVKV